MRLSQPPVSRKLKSYHKAKLRQELPVSRLYVYD